MNLSFKLTGITFALLISNAFLNLNAANSSPFAPPLDEATSAQAKLVSSKKWSKLPESLRDTELCLHGVALFSGSSFYGRIIKETTGSKWSHTGMIFSPKKDRSQSNWHLLEACHFPGKPFYEISSYNVHALPWADSSFRKNDEVVVRTFHYTGEEPSSNRVKNVLNKYLDVPYERHPLELFRAAFEANRTEDASSIFCSELNALVLQDLGMIPPKVVPNNYVPADFSIGRPNALKLTGATLGREVIIKEAKRIGLARVLGRVLRFV